MRNESSLAVVDKPPLRSGWDNLQAMSPEGSSLDAVPLGMVTLTVPVRGLPTGEDEPAGVATGDDEGIATRVLEVATGESDSAATASQAEFRRGYRAAGGDPDWEGHVVNVVIPCESSWNVDPGGPHLGLAQFSEDTWAKASRPGADYRDPYEQGWAVATWMGMIADWDTTAGWPRCWR